ncbi:MULTISPECIES: hypothetical protein [unclassified Trichocoleus]|nr:MULTISPECIES: hypothetical protein [unclassified Trichocoleus]
MTPTIDLPQEPLTLTTLLTSASRLRSHYHLLYFSDLILTC